MRPDLVSLASARLAQPWALTPAALESLRATIARVMEDMDDAPKVAAKPKATGNRRGKCTLIPVHGTLVHRTDNWSDLFGEVGYEDLARAIKAAVADDTSDGIVLDFTTPGGSAYGASECAAAIASAAKVKKVIGIADPLAASGGYWLLSQCSEVAVAPSGECGSIGVFQLHVDQSKYLEEMGIKISVERVGKLKASSNPYEPLSDDGRAEIQRGLAAIYDRFVKDVARGRGASQTRVREGFGQGGMCDAEEAVKEGMADRVATLDEVLARYGGVSLMDSASAQSESAQRAEIEIRRRKAQLT